MITNPALAIPKEYYGFTNIRKVHQKGENFVLVCNIDKQFPKDTNSATLFAPFPVIMISCNVPFTITTEYGWFQSVDNKIKFDDSCRFIPTDRKKNIKFIRNLLNNDPLNQKYQIFYENFPHYKSRIQNLSLNLSGLKQCVVIFNNNPNNEEINLQLHIFNIGVVSPNNTEQLFGMKFVC